MAGEDEGAAEESEPQSSVEEEEEEMGAEEAEDGAREGVEEVTGDWVEEGGAQEVEGGERSEQSQGLGIGDAHTAVVIASSDRSWQAGRTSILRDDEWLECEGHVRRERTVREGHPESDVARTRLSAPLFGEFIYTRWTGQVMNGMAALERPRHGGRPAVCVQQPAYRSGATLEEDKGGAVLSASSGARLAATYRQRRRANGESIPPRRDALLASASIWPKTCDGVRSSKCLWWSSSSPTAVARGSLSEHGTRRQGLALTSPSLSSTSLSNSGWL